MGTANVRDVSGNLRAGNTVGNTSNGASGGPVAKALQRLIIGTPMGRSGNVATALESGTIQPKSDMDTTLRR